MVCQRIMILFSVLRKIWEERAYSAAIILHTRYARSAYIVTAVCTGMPLFSNPYRYLMYASFRLPNCKTISDRLLPPPVYMVCESTGWTDWNQRDRIIIGLPESYFQSMYVKRVRRFVSQWNSGQLTLIIKYPDPTDICRRYHVHELTLFDREAPSVLGTEDTSTHKYSAGHVSEQAVLVSSM